MIFDFIIIGAGVIGSSTAYHLKRLNSKLKILLLDQNSKVAEGNTSRSAALYRNLFSSQTSQTLSTSSITFYETIAEKIALKNLGYFWMFSKEDWLHSKNGLEKLNTTNDRFEILEQDEIPDNLKLNVSGSKEFSEIYRVLYGHRCGALSAINLARYYASEYQSLGGKLSLNTQIVRINLSEKKRFYPPWADVKINSLIDNNGTKYQADNYIFATGAWTNNLLAPIGVASQVYPKKRQMFTLKLRDSTQLVNDPTKAVPILILPSGGVYLKPILQNKIIMVGSANELGNPYQMGKFPPETEEGYFYNAIEPVLLHYFPELTNYQLFSQWAGYYAYYWPDKNPIIEKIANIQWVSGTSGSGIMKADAIGRIAAAKALNHDEIALYDNIIFKVKDLSLKGRKVDQEELII